MIGRSEENSEERPREREEFDYEVVDPDLPPRDARGEDHDLAGGRRELEAIEDELARDSGNLARWGALIMLVVILLMLVLPRIGCSLKQYPYR